MLTKIFTILRHFFFPYLNRQLRNQDILFWTLSVPFCGRFFSLFWTPTYFKLLRTPTYFKLLIFIYLYLYLSLLSLPAVDSANITSALASRQTTTTSPMCRRRGWERGNCPSRDNMIVNDVNASIPLLTILWSPVHLRSEVRQKTALSLSSPRL
jgi:hypothetical protein